MSRLVYAIIATALCGCSATSGSTSTADAVAQDDTLVHAVSTPVFDADSAYSHVARQVAFGPRVPGSDANRLCREYLVGEFKAYGADTVLTQSFEATAWDGKRLPLVNIMASYNPDAAKRIVIAAHYDTRPWADNEADPQSRFKPIDGANDGASGVGVIMELARLMGMQSPRVGVDLLLVDGEDYGWSEEIADIPVKDSDETWCLGSRYWAKNMPYKSAVRPAYGVVLDMVGGTDARFHREILSDYFARDIVDKLWAAAARAGASDRFVNQPGSSVNDDHIPLNQAGIPTVDVIEYRQGGFSPTWHTHADNLANIDPATLGAVGQAICELIYNE
ncbi:MAG: M28 family peptidase [Paramuribaculum sp.]|nr:M28 family peptidase [Paramuribaculum sp.]